MSENEPKNTEEEPLKDLNITTKAEKETHEIQDGTMDDLDKQIQSKDMVLEMFKKTIFPALKSKIEFLENQLSIKEEQLSIKEQKLEIIKMKEDLSELILDSPLPLPI